MIEERIKHIKQHTDLIGLIQSLTPEDIIKAYPGLGREDITQALKYAAWLSSEKVKLIPLKGTAGA